MKKKLVQLTVENPQQIDYVQAPVSSGVPLPPELDIRNGACFELQDDSGRTVPAQFTPLAWYPGGVSVKWLLVSLLADVPAGGERYYSLMLGEDKSQKCDNRWMASTAGEEVSIDTGRLQCKVRKDRKLLSDMMYRHDDGVWKPCGSDPAFRLMIDQKIYTAAAPQDIGIEDNGPVRTLVRAAGQYVSLDGDESSDYAYVLRIEAWRGRADVRLTHTIINQGTDRQVQDVSVEWGSDDAQSCMIGRNDGYCQPVPQTGKSKQGVLSESCELSKLGDLTASVGELVKGAYDWWASLHTEDASISTTVRDFHERYPKSLEFTDSGSLRVGLLPGVSTIKDSFVPSNQLLDSYRFREGEARTHELMFSIGSPESDPETVRRSMMAFHKPLLALAPWNWYADSGALGDIAPRSSEYAEFEQAADESLAIYLGRREAGQLYGDRNYGDDEYGRLGTWNNGEYDYTHVGMLHFLRGAGRDWYERFARPYARHLMDIDVCHAGSGAGKIYAHCEWHNSEEPKLGSHAWLRGLIEYYCFSGDMRAREVAVHVADTWSASILRGQGLEGTERGITWPIISMLGMYQVIPEERYLQAAQALIDIVIDCHDPIEGHFAGTMFRPTTKDYWGTFVIGSPVLESLIMYEQLTGDAQVREIVVRAAKRLARLNWIEDVGEWEYTHSMLKGDTRVHNAKTNKMVTPAVLYAYLYSGDEELLDKSLQAFRSSVRTPANHGKDLGQSYCFGIRIPALLNRCLKLREERRSGHHAGGTAREER